MATHKSAAKRARQAVKRSARNNSTASALKSFEKRLRTAVAGKDVKAATEALKSVVSQLDKAASKGVIHARNAARKASRLAKLVSSLNS